MEKKGNLVMQVTLESGKFLYTDPRSYNAEMAINSGLECEIVEYSGPCSYATINKGVHEGIQGIKIDGIPAENFIKKIATPEECSAWARQF